MIKVIAGNDKATTGRSDASLTEKTQPRRSSKASTFAGSTGRRASEDPQGAERVQEECAIHASNVMLDRPEDWKGRRASVLA